MTLTDYLDTIEAAPRGNARLEALNTLTQLENDEATSLLEKYFVTATNGFITFGIAKLPEPPVDSTKGVFFQNDIAWVRELFALAEQLRTRKLTGNAARDQIGLFLADCNVPQRKWGERFLLKDLRLNIGAIEINKAYGPGTVPIFEVPLATDYSKLKDKEWKQNEMWMLQPKLDGARCVAFIDSEGQVELLSRSGLTWGNFESVRKTVTEFAQRFNLKDFVLDGEVVSLRDDYSIDFQQLQKTLHRGDGVEVGFLQYVVFDGCSRQEWESPRLTYGQRFAALKDLVGPVDAKTGEIPGVPRSAVIIESWSSAMDKKNAEKASVMFVNRGYEGGILRNPDAVVKNKRTKDILKIKSFTDAEASIVGYIEGTGKYVGTLGALKCVMVYSDPCEVVHVAHFDMGSGFSDKQRDELWAIRETLAGKDVVLKFFELTNDHVPRFPIFKSIRHEKDMSK